jgi:hypothetical protein
MALSVSVAALAANGPAAALAPMAPIAQSPGPLVRPTPELVAAMRAAALASKTPAVVSVELPAMTVQQIVDRNTAARGGAQAWQAVRSMSMVGKLDAGTARVDGGAASVVSKADRAKAKAELRRAMQEGKQLADTPKVIQLPFQMDMQRPVKTRLEIPFQGETAVQIYDGTKGWKLRPFLGRHEVEAFNEDELKIAAGQQELDGPLLNYAAKGTALAFVGGELVDGRGAYKLRLTLKSGQLRHVWIDAQTFLDVKMDGEPRRINGKEHAVQTYLRDYRSVSGLMIAHRLETTLEGVPGSESIYVEKVALNPMWDDTRFAKPQ